MCGYIETADNADKPCPACGFPKTVWAEYTPRKLNPTRKRLLDLHLHPIAVHFPIAGSALTVGLPILGLLVPYSLGYRLFDFAMMVCLVMPLLVLIGGISGYIGGNFVIKQRQRRFKIQNLLIRSVFRPDADTGLCGIFV